ncbi:MBL fold metallo-hydrolase [Pendulispora brunnea]|uniref:MBL fold metallo-hydrolase n=1 Tax=Pendulispora brunnea TaxID=2905690 RepID=A0ABZ2KAR3_9BACT
MRASSHTEVLFVNHSSLLIRYGDEYLLTDPWYQRPAFGSWLPVPPMAVHPASLVALGSKLRILISHAHDDHCDNQFLQLFDKSSAIVSTNFASKSVERRLGKLGFTNLHMLSPAGEQLGSFRVRSFVNEKLSHDDALYLIETPDAAVVHGNDLWVPLESAPLSAIKAAVIEKGANRALYASQTNSASGFPTTYRNFSPQEKARLLRKKVDGMIDAGLQNAAAVGASHFLSYAGFSGAFVKDKEEYLGDAIIPDYDYIAQHFGSRIPSNVTVLDMRPGDAFDFHEVKKSFFGNDIAVRDLKQAAIDYYRAYGVVDTCDTFRVDSDSIENGAIEERLERYLLEFDKFVKGHVERTKFESTILGKTLEVFVEDVGVHRALRFGHGLVHGEETWNKRIVVSSKLISMVMEKKILLENLYTGFNAEFVRNPPDVYNRDIVMYLVMFSYAYINRRQPT